MDDHMHARRKSREMGNNEFSWSDLTLGQLVTLLPGLRLFASETNHRYYMGA